MSRIAVVFGTRPELIKLYPVIIELRKTKNEILVINSNQQKDLISNLNMDFNLDIDYEYDSDFKNTTLPTKFSMYKNFALISNSF